jgi:N-acetylglucosaminyldiphosphoundecaprenol N-acetyl-beta-D-mannosaminyltransferase
MASRTKRVRRKVRFGHIHADDLDFDGALEAIAELVANKEGGFVVTPNVDHVCLAEERADLVLAYQKAALSLADGMPLLWLAKAMRTPLPQKISGSDLLVPLCRQAAQKGHRVYLLGGADGAGEGAARALKSACPGLVVAGIDAPPMGFERDAAKNGQVLQKIRDAKADLVLVALGCPKQELWMADHVEQYAPAVALGIGASLDFLAGKVRRAPAWMSNSGLEWLYRLLQEPKRMAGRYLVRDRAIVRIAWRMLRLPPARRSFFG